MRANRGIKSTVKEGYCCQNIECILLSNIPVDLWCMGGCVSEGAEDTLDQIYQAIMLVPFTVGGEGVEREAGMTGFPIAKASSTS